MTWIRALVAVLVLFTGFAGCLGDDESAADAVPAPEGVLGVPHVVVAVIDTGINPYHTEFRDLMDAASDASPRAATLADAGVAGFGSPERLIPGYPEDAVPLSVSLDASDYQGAVEADAELWNSVQPGELVHFPGTKIVGAISFEQDGLLVDRQDVPYVLDTRGHGTMVASRIAGNTVSIGGAEVRLVSVQMGGRLDELASAVDGVNWVAAQDWIDVVSCSWGLPAPHGPAAEGYTAWTDAIKNLAAKKPTFFSAGNGLGNGLGTGYPSEFQDTLPADVIAVGGHDNGRYVYWSNWNPQVSGDVLYNPAAEHDSIDKVSNTGGGTSSSSPFTAGGGAAVLLEARKILDHGEGVLPDGVLAVAGPGAALPAEGPLADGDFTLAEFKSVLFHTAVYPQEDASDGEASELSIPIPMQDALPATLYPFFGYGEVNADSVAAAIAVLRGEESEPERVVEDALYEQDYALRQAMYGS